MFAKYKVYEFVKPYKCYGLKKRMMFFFYRWVCHIKSNGHNSSYEIWNSQTIEGVETVKNLACQMKILKDYKSDPALKVIKQYRVANQNYSIAKRSKQTFEMNRQNKILIDLVQMLSTNLLKDLSRNGKTMNQIAVKHKQSLGRLTHPNLNQIT